MDVTKLSTKGQVILPKSIRDSRHWRPGTEFMVEATVDGVLLRPIKPGPASSLQDVVGCLGNSGPARTVDEMERAID